MKQLITLLSNASLSVYPNNSLTKFVNQIPNKITPLDKTVLKIKLLNLTISNILKPDATKPDIVLILLKELDPQAVGTGYSQVLGKFQWKVESTIDEYSFYQFEHSPVLDLSVNQLVKFSITLVNEKEEQLELDVGSPTFINIFVGDSEMAESQFTITCKSNLSTSFFPNNTLTHFKTILPRAMNLKGWEIGVSNIVFPARMSGSFLVSIDLEENILSYNLLKFTSLNALQTKIRSDITRLNLASKVDCALSLGGLVFKNISAIGSEINVRCILSDGWIVLTGSPRRELGGVINPQSFVSISGPLSLLHVRPSHVSLLHSNIVQESIVGDRYAQLLDVLPTFKHYNTLADTLYEPQRLLFRPVIENEFRFIEIDFRQPDGSELNMNTSLINKSCIVTLIFRPVRTKLVAQ